MTIGSDWTPLASLDSAHFDYMKWDLHPADRDILKANAAELKTVMEKLPEAQIRVEGNCDQRGTEEYNLALGQRRADEVKDYYVHMGLPASALKTVSNGKEKLLCSEDTEACWAQNRRAQTMVRSPKGEVRLNVTESSSPKKS